MDEAERNESWLILINNYNHHCNLLQTNDIEFKCYKKFVCKFLLIQSVSKLL